MPISRQLALCFIQSVFLLLCCGCGGGTYGTGGDSESRTLRFVTRSGNAIADLRVRTAGVNRESFSSVDGTAEIELNQALEVQVLRVEWLDGATIDLYVRTRALAAGTITPVYLDDTNDSELIPMAGPDCEEIVTSLAAGIMQDENGIPASAQTLIEEANEDTRTTRSCEDLLPDIVDTVFEPTAADGGDIDDPTL